MGTKATGAYLRTLREAQKLGRGALAKVLKTNDSQLERIENGQIDTRGSSLMALVAAVHGNPAHIQQLLLNKKATEEDGRQLAEQWLAQGGIAVDSLPEEVAMLANKLASDSQRLGQWIGYGQRLLEEQDGEEDGAEHAPQAPQADC